MGAASIRFNFRSGFSHLNNPFLHPALEATSSALSQPLLATLLHVMCFSCTSCNSIPRSCTEHSTQNTPGAGAGRSLFLHNWAHLITSLLHPRLSTPLCYSYSLEHELWSLPQHVSGQKLHLSTLPTWKPLFAEGRLDIAPTLLVTV